MPKNRGSRISPGARLRDLPLSDMTSALNQLQNGASVQTEEARALRYKARLSEARIETNEADEHRPHQPASPKSHRGDIGQGYTLRQRMELIEMFRHFSKTTNIEVTPSNFGEFMDIPIKRQSITQWNKDFNKIRFDVAHGRDDKPTISSNPVDLIRHILNKTVYDWLLEVRRNKSVVTDLQLQAAAESVLHILMDDILAFEDIPLGCTISYEKGLPTARHDVLSKARVDKLEQDSVSVKKRPPLYPPVLSRDASQVRRHYVRLSASVMDGDKIQFSLDKNQKDAQDMAEAIKQKMRNKITKRYSSRDRSSSMETDAVESFKSKYKGDWFAAEVGEMLTGEDASDRKAACHMIRRKSQHN
ncbi:hypothetical protein BGZ47_010114 [Haplosporangium gracile]|nr:hypothetical protein BGZ47_010114 [Haplosporangium gracile]